MSRETIFAEIAQERWRQDQKFGGAVHDDTHSATDWISIIVRHLGLAVDDGSPAGVCLMDDHCAGFDPERYRRQMIRVAAIAVAALEVFDRKTATAASPSELARARLAQMIADGAGCPALLILQPPPSLEYDPHLPYIVLEAEATKQEKAMPYQRFTPGGHHA